MGGIFETPGEFIRRLIEAGEVSQRRLAQTLGIDGPRLNKWLSGKEMPPPEYLPVMMRQLGAEDEDLGHLHALLDIEQWRRKMRRMSPSPAIAATGVSMPELANHLIALAAELSLTDHAADSARSRERMFAEHLHSAHQVLHTVNEVLGSDDTMLFHPENVRFHVRYPANFYVGAFLGLEDSRVGGGTALARAVEALVDDVTELDSRNTFLATLSTQHAHHVKARYGRGESDHGARLRKSADVHDRRMFLIGQALRPDATDDAWSALFENLTRPDFQAAVVAFDAGHYDNNEVQSDGWLPHPVHVRTTALRYLAGLAATDPRHVEFAAQRLMNLIEFISPATLRRARLGAAVRHQRDIGVQNLPKAGLDAMQVIEQNEPKEE